MVYFMNRDIITFDPKEHKYWNQNNIEYVPVTILLNAIFPFDRVEIAEKVTKIGSSKYYGRSIDRILSLWDNTSIHGKTIHTMVENYIKNHTYPTDNSLIPLLEQFKLLNFSGSLLSEVLVWDERYRIAGTVDILECCDKYIYLWDIKTSSHIDDDKLMKFSMQLEIYKRIVEHHFNTPVKIGGILWFEDYVMKRKRAKMKVLRTLHCVDSVNEILLKREREIICQK